MKTHLPFPAAGLAALSLSLSLGIASAQTAAPVAPASTPPASAAPSTTAPASGVFRVWRDVQGRSVEATFRGVENGNVYLQIKSGYVYRIPLERLVPEDQAIARTLKPEGLGIPADPNVAQAAQKIDEIVNLGLKVKGQQPNALASDEQFVRRVYLDLAGRIPTREETMTFLADTSVSKRSKVIDRLVNSEGFTSRMFNYFTDMLRMADDAQKSKFFTYEEWFKGQLAKNRPWNELVYDMMTADGRLLDNGAAGYLLRDQGMRLDNLSLTLSTFLGANVACAQCHDHPFAEWSQRQFYEMAAFFGATETYGGRGGKKGGSEMQKTMRGLRTELTQREFQQARRLMYANALAVTDTGANELTLPEDYKYKDGKAGDSVAPKLIAWTKEDLKLPSYLQVDAVLKKKDHESATRDAFAKWMTSADNPRFAMAISNRLWKLMFGIAVKEPVSDLDDPDSSNNPMLLHHLTKEMVRLKFDIRAFMRLLCNTQTYQREAITKEVTPGEPYYFPGPVLRRMTAEQAWDSCVTLAIGDKVDGFKLKRAEKYVEVMNLSGSEITAEEVRTKLAAMRGAMGDPLLNGNAKGPKKGKAAMMRRQQAQTAGDDGEVDHTRPEVMEGLVLARASELPQPEREQHFLRMFGQSDRQIADSGSDEGSIPQVLMLMNGEAQHVLRHARSLVLSTALKQDADAQKVTSLYVSFFSRVPTSAEMDEAKQALAGGLTLEDLTWVLFNTREFVFVQ